MSSIWLSLMGHPVAQRFHDAGGVRTRAIEAGEGENVLIFLHGTGGHAEAYTRNLVAHAAAGFRVYSIDMVGHGFTDAPDLDYEISDFVDHLEAFVDAIGAKKVSLSGESLGGQVGAWYAIRHPERMNRLVLNTGMIMHRDEEGKAELRDMLERSRKASGQTTRETVRGRLAWLMHEPEKSVTEELVDARFAIYSQPGRGPVMRKVAESVITSIIDPEPEKIWADPAVMRDIACPTLVLWSRYNPGMSVARAELAMKEIPDARIVVLENSAHWPQWEEHEVFNEKHIAFLHG